MESLDVRTRYSPIEASIHLSRYQFAFACGPVGRVLDVACGYGYGTHRLAACSGVQEVVGVDRDPNAISHAISLPTEARPTFRIVDLDAADELERLGTFDTVISIETLEHIARPAELLARLQELWTREGPFIISLPNDPLYYGRGMSLNQYHLSSGSWIDGRNWAERVLGEGQWYFGSVAAGFSIHAVDGNSNVGASYSTVMGSSIEPVSCISVPNPSDSKLLPSGALFYMGVWHGSRGDTRDPRETAVLFPADGQYRIPDFLSAPVSVQKGYKPNLYMFVNTKRSDHHTLATQICTHFAQRFTVEIVRVGTCEEELAGVLRRVANSSGPIFLHFFDLECAKKLVSDFDWTGRFCWQSGVEPHVLAKRLGEAVITAFACRSSLIAEETAEEVARGLNLLDGLGISSAPLRRYYGQKLPAGSITLLRGGVDLTLLRPRRLERFQDESRPLVVGWSGSVAGNATAERFRDELETRIKPAIECLLNEGCAVVSNFAKRPDSEPVSDYLAQLDVLVCPSEDDLTSGPMMEAIACGLPVIAFDSGAARDLLGPLQNDFVLDNSNVESLVEALRELHDHRSRLFQLSEENIARREHLALSDELIRWMKFFRKAESAHRMRQVMKHSLYDAAVARAYQHAGGEQHAVKRKEKEGVLHSLRRRWLRGSR